MLDVHPQLSDLQIFIKKVPGYPVSAEQLVNLAVKEKADPQVIQFYKAFPPDEVFSDRDDLVARSENIGILHEENPPEEVLTAPEED